MLVIQGRPDIEKDILSIMHAIEVGLCRVYTKAAAALKEENDAALKEETAESLAAKKEQIALLLLLRRHRGVALQVCVRERQFLKPVFRLIGSRLWV